MNRKPRPGWKKCRDRGPARRETMASSRLGSPALEVHPTTAEVDYTPEQVEFGRAMERFQRKHGRHATAADVLAVARSLGYERRSITSIGDDFFLVLENGDLIRAPYRAIEDLLDARENCS